MLAAGNLATKCITLDKASLSHRIGYKYGAGQIRFSITDSRDVPAIDAWVWR